MNLTKLTNTLQGVFTQIDEALKKDKIIEELMNMNKSLKHKLAKKVKENSDLKKTMSKML